MTTNTSLDEGKESQINYNLLFGKIATADKWIAAFKEWINSHRGLNLPNLSDEDISRESIYGERG
ncbi:hypothetical protein NIES4071_84760 [Calothrix sp. NIES-4071]|nr:hypothetical protein NIES4071_84760 [Calothrix sp. NIES-4071]BAZ62743.1 hypothetical protein NIES4105_84690 [Calothrix sp. NIES-4105]